MTDERAPRLSVLVPTYNYAAYVEEALVSVFEQDVEGVEVVVADDGSTDGTEAVLRPWADAGRIRYFRQANAGPSAARNLALRQARGRALMFLDADDALRPGCIATTVDFLQRHPDVGMFFTNYDIFDSEGVIDASGIDAWKAFRSIPHRETSPGEWIFTESLTPYILRYGSFMHTSGLTLTREVAEKAGVFREGFSYGEDDDFYARAAYVTTAGYVDQVLSRKRNHDRSLIHDPGNRLRNQRHLLELTELQEDDYRHDGLLRQMLRKKAKDCAVSYGWSLIECGRIDEARSLLRRYMARHPFSWPLYKLLAKSALRRNTPVVAA